MPDAIPAAKILPWRCRRGWLFSRTSDQGLNLSKREAKPFGEKRFAEGVAERNETFPLGVNLPGFYPAVCPARPHGVDRIATLGPDTASMSSRNPSHINS